MFLNMIGYDRVLLLAMAMQSSFEELHIKINLELFTAPVVWPL